MKSTSSDYKGKANRSTPNEEKKRKSPVFDDYQDASESKPKLLPIISGRNSGKVKAISSKRAIPSAEFSSAELQQLLKI